MNVDTRQHANKQPHAHALTLNTHKHTEYKPKVSSHRQEMMSVLVSKEMEAVAKIL